MKKEVTHIYNTPAARAAATQLCQSEKKCTCADAAVLARDYLWATRY